MVHLKQVLRATSGPVNSLKKAPWPFVVASKSMISLLVPELLGIRKNEAEMEVDGRL